MLKLALAGLLVAGALGAAPTLAAPAGGDTIGRGCTRDPFTHTQRCIDFDHCTTDRNGNRTCPTTITPTRAHVADSKVKTTSKGKHETQDYLVVTLTDASVTSY